MAKTLLGASALVGLVAMLSACSGPGSALSTVAAPTATAELAHTIAPAPTQSGPVGAPAPAQSGSDVAPAPAQGGPVGAPAAVKGAPPNAPAPAQGRTTIAPAPPPGVVGQGSGGVAVGAPAIAVMAPAPVAQMGVGSSGSFSPQVAPAPATEILHGIVVSGSGHVDLRPDQATVTAGVQTQGRTALEAQTQNNRTMDAVIAAIKALGIQDKDIQTVGTQLYPIYDQGQTVSGYSSTNNVTVLVQNVDQAGPVLDAAVNAGANVASNVTFGLKDETAARNKALTLAAVDARSKADALAGALSLHISDTQSVTEASSGGPIYTSPRALAAPAATSSAAVEPGQLSVTAQVTIVFGY